MLTLPGGEQLQLCQGTLADAKSYLIDQEIIVVVSDA